MPRAPMMATVGCVMVVFLWFVGSDVALADADLPGEFGIPRDGEVVVGEPADAGLVIAEQREAGGVHAGGAEAVAGRLAAVDGGAAHGVGLCGPVVEQLVAAGDDA